MNKKQVLQTTNIFQFSMGCEKTEYQAKSGGLYQVANKALFVRLQSLRQLIYEQQVSPQNRSTWSVFWKWSNWSRRTVTQTSFLNKEVA